MVLLVQITVEHHVHPLVERTVHHHVVLLVHQLVKELVRILVVRHALETLVLLIVLMLVALIVEILAQVDVVVRLVVQVAKHLLVGEVALLRPVAQDVRLLPVEATVLVILVQQIAQHHLVEVGVEEHVQHLLAVQLLVEQIAVVEDVGQTAVLVVELDALHHVIQNVLVNALGLVEIVVRMGVPRAVRVVVRMVVVTLAPPVVQEVVQMVVAPGSVLQPAGVLAVDKW